MTENTERLLVLEGEFKMILRVMNIIRCTGVYSKLDSSTQNSLESVFHIEEHSVIERIQRLAEEFE